MFIAVVFCVNKEDPPHEGWVEIFVAPTRLELGEKVKRGPHVGRYTIVDVIEISTPAGQRKIEVMVPHGNTETKCG